MKRKFLFGFLILSWIGLQSYAQSPQTEVHVISTIHAAHKTNKNYTYEDLFVFIDKLNPDVVGVEIRPEDKDSSSNFLKNMYPYEMYESLVRYKHKKTYGIDWLGADVAGKQFTREYWENVSPIRKLQVKLGADSLMRQKLAVLKIVGDAKVKIALNADVYTLNNGTYDMLNEIYYAQMRESYKGEDYEQLATFYLNRDQEIAKNIIKVIEANMGKKIVFLVGADHRSFTLNAIQNKFGNSILMNPKLDK